MSISSCKYDTENHLWQTIYFFSVKLQSYFCCFIAVFSCTYNWSISTIQLRYVKAFQKILKHVFFCKHHKDTRSFYENTKTDFSSSHFGVMDVCDPSDIQESGRWDRKYSYLLSCYSRFIFSMLFFTIILLSSHSLLCTCWQNWMLYLQHKFQTSRRKDLQLEMRFIENYKSCTCIKSSYLILMYLVVVSRFRLLNWFLQQDDRVD